MCLVVFAAMGAYLLLSIAVIAGTASFVRKRGRSGLRWGAAAALGMWLIPFWDWIPTVVMHRYYCENEAGFWGYKTVDQLRTENQTVTASPSPNQSIRLPMVGESKRVNDRFVIQIQRRKPVAFLPTVISERLLVDLSKDEVIARAVEIGSGVGYIATGGSFKFWLNQKPCTSPDFWKLVATIENMGSKR